MCGLAGFWSRGPVDRERARRMSAALAHRGPDGDGELFDGEVALVHRRLAIIDPTPRSAQPMEGLVFNGEIYNYKALREELRGAVFRSDGDTEVLLRGLQREGVGFLSRIDGDFAFAWWNGSRLLLGRDRFGVKPLYFAEGDGEFLFASEIRALLAAGWPAEPHLPALAEALKFRYAKGAHTAFRGIHRLLPGHALMVTREGRRLERWYQLRPREEATLDELHHAFVESVRLRLHADVPVGVLLSGGLDSTAIASALRSSTRARLHAFTYGVPGALSETAAAARAAAELGLEAHVVENTAHQLDALRATVSALEEPIGDSIVLPNYHLFRECRRHVKVVLSGEGADEIFGGYSHQLVLGRLAWLRAKMNPLAGVAASLVGLVPLDLLNRLSPYPARLSGEARARLVSLLGAPTIARAHELATALFDDDELATLAPELYAALPPPGPPLGDGWDHVLFADIADWLPNYGLLRTDKLSMAHALEVRVPYLSHHVVEAALGLTLRQFAAPWSRDKGALRAMARARLPGAAFRKRKQPFFLPVESAYDGRFAALAEETLRRTPLFDPHAVGELRRRAGSDFLANKKLAALVHFQLWWDAFYGSPS